MFNICTSISVTAKDREIYRRNAHDKSTFLANERQRPCEDVHEVGQPVRVRRAVELTNVHYVVLVLQDCRCKLSEILERLKKIGGRKRTLIVVDVEVVGRTEDGDERRETGRCRLAVHAIAGVLCLVRANDRQQVVVLQEVTACQVTVK